ncbi:Lrp/AsnC family transcriptional regulator [Bacillus pumilus]|nr:Lrp/AsnC family transcriptional regulator [Bacillus pumilus]
MLDHTDIRILDELFKNSRMTMKELGEKVHLTGPATSTRVTKLKESGVIEGYTMKVNRVKLGCFIHAFITVMTEGIFHKPYLTFIKTEEKYILHNYKTSGEGCYLLEAQFPSTQVMNTFLEKLNEHANYK